jgi:UDP-glucose 4-epimerase
MKCLVTGGAGFIGSHLVDKLISLGHIVIVIDDESAVSNSEFYHNDIAVYYNKDICDYESTRQLYNNVDFVFHLAANARIQIGLNNPIRCVEVNTLGTTTVLQCAREAGVKKVIYSSTSSSYGLKNKPPLKEDMIEDCLNPYSVSKVAGEKLCQMYTDLFDLKTVTLRYFNVYGERQPLKGQYAPVVGLFLEQAKRGDPLTIAGDGEQRRDFTHVSDVVRANVDCMYTNVYGIINIGTGRNYSVNEIAKMISNDHVYIDARPGESRETLANISKAKFYLDWEPKVRIKDWIDEYKLQCGL